MRKIVCSIAAMMIMAFALQSCSNSPKASADKFLTSFYHMDFEGAKKVSTDDTKKMLDMMQQFSSLMPDSSKEQLKKLKVDIKNVAETGDSATVTYVTSDNPKDQTLHMVKKSGKWLVQMNKQDSMGGGDNAPSGDQPSPADTSAAPPANTTGTPADTTAAPKQ